MRTGWRWKSVRLGLGMIAVAGSAFPVGAQERDSLPPWRGWSVGGSVGYRSLGGDFRAAGGPGGEIALGLVAPAGAAIDFGLRVDSHGTGGGPRIWVLGMRAEPRYLLGAGSVVAFLGARATLDFWGFTVGDTDISAPGAGIGATLGMLAGEPGQPICMVIAATWDRMWFADAGTDEFRFSGTSATARQLGFEFGLRVRLEKRERKVGP